MMQESLGNHSRLEGYLCGPALADHLHRSNRSYAAGKPLEKGRG
jgi:hypothetical protein